jgi:hypothetical protein
MKEGSRIQDPEPPSPSLSVSSVFSVADLYDGAASTGLDLTGLKRSLRRRKNDSNRR